MAAAPHCGASRNSARPRANARTAGGARDSANDDNRPEPERGLAAFWTPRESGGRLTGQPIKQATSRYKRPGDAGSRREASGAPSADSKAWKPRLRTGQRLLCTLPQTGNSRSNRDGADRTSNAALSPWGIPRKGVDRQQRLSIVVPRIGQLLIALKTHSFRGRELVESGGEW
jgi:hypothetical protein